MEAECHGSWIPVESHLRNMMASRSRVSSRHSRPPNFERWGLKLYQIEQEGVRRYLLDIPDGNFGAARHRHRSAVPGLESLCLSYQPPSVNMTSNEDDSNSSIPTWCRIFCVDNYLDRNGCFLNLNTRSS